MNLTNNQTLISQAEYVKRLRPFIPDDAFAADPSKLFILVINLVILLLGWGIANRLDCWSTYLLWLYLPLTVVMGNSVIVLAFSSHDLMHGAVMRNRYLNSVFSLLGVTVLWIPPTLWKIIHNRIHHHKTNSLTDPDRNYLFEQPNTWGKWIQNFCTPSIDINPISLGVGMMTFWVYYAFRNLTSVLLFNNESVNYLPANFTVSDKERQTIWGQFLIILIMHLSILTYLQFNPIKIFFSYFLPLGIGYAGTIFYIYTNHLFCQMTSVNDPLVNSISLRVPKIFDLLHLNFSYHTEHHIFPGMNSDYYPLVRELLKVHYPERMNYLLDAQEAWRLLLTTHRHYKDEKTLTDWSGKNSVPCPLNRTTSR